MLRLNMMMSSDPTFDWKEFRLSQSYFGRFQTCNVLKNSPEFFILFSSLRESQGTPLMFDFYSNIHSMQRRAKTTLITCNASKKRVNLFDLHLKFCFMWLKIGAYFRRPEGGN